MINNVRDAEGRSIARADVNDGKVHLSVGAGAYQITEFTPEQARELALNLMVLAARVSSIDERV